MNNEIIITNLEPQEILISGGGEVYGITDVFVNGINVTEGDKAYIVVPTKTSELINDSGFLTVERDPTVPYYVKEITQNDIINWNNKQNALVSGSTIKTINNENILGSGNIDISLQYEAGTGIGIENNTISNLITSYDDLSNLPTIPENTSELINDSNFVTSDELAEVAFNGSYNALSDTPIIPSATSELVNDSNFVTTTSYASSSTGGVIVTSATTGGVNINANGNIYGYNKDYTYYKNTMNNYYFITKGTLEAVFFEKIKSITGYNASSVQILKNDNGTLKWVDE